MLTLHNIAQSIVRWQVFICSRHTLRVCSSITWIACCTTPWVTMISRVVTSITTNRNIYGSTVSVEVVISKIRVISTILNSSSIIIMIIVISSGYIMRVTRRTTTTESVTVICWLISSITTYSMSVIINCMTMWYNYSIFTTTRCINSITITSTYNKFIL